MPRDGSGVWSPPPGSTAVPNATITSAMWNAALGDLATDANAARPITAGGTGATAASGARTNLDLIPMATEDDLTIDGSSPRLMRRGAFGLGKTVGQMAIPSNDCNSIVACGFYQGVANTTANMPTSTHAYHILHFAQASNVKAQLAIRSNGLLFRRAMNFAGSYGAWAQIDAIAETGSNANGSYIKWDSGKIECRHNVTFNAAISSAFMGGFRCAERTWDFPVSFNDGLGNPDVYVQPKLGTAFSGIRTDTPVTATQAFYAVTAVTSQTAADRAVSLYAVRL